jgi:hypothetical protein
MFRLRMVLASFLMAGLCMIGGFSSASPGEEKERHPHIHAAIHELKHAHKELKEANHDFGGHREKALKDIDAAIKQLEECLKHDKK